MWRRLNEIALSTHNIGRSDTSRSESFKNKCNMELFHSIFVATVVLNIAPNQTKIIRFQLNEAENKTNYFQYEKLFRSEQCWNNTKCKSHWFKFNYFIVIEYTNKLNRTSEMQFDELCTHNISVISLYFAWCFSNFIRLNSSLARAVCANTMADRMISVNFKYLIFIVLFLVVNQFW